MEEYLAVIGNNASSNDSKTVTMFGRCSEWNNATYGNVVIPSLSPYICVWEIKINSGDYNNLGITSGKAKPNEACFRRKNDFNYAYTSLSGKKMSQHKIVQYSGNSFRKGDKIKIKLDLVQKELSFYKNNRHQGVAYDNIRCGANISYRLAISQAVKSCSVTLVDFKKFQLFQEQKEVEKEQKIDELNKTLQKEQKQNKRLMQKIDELNIRIEELENDEKEKEMTIQEMTKQIEDLKIKSVDTSKYKSWKHDDIFLWIMSLDSEMYKPYKEKLKKNLQAQQLTGEDLKDIEGGDIIDLGINVFKHKKLLLKAIKQLVNQSQKTSEGLFS
eukprot:550951_1